MVRFLVVLLLAQVPVWGHGGAFRPPPRVRAGDPYKPQVRKMPSTARRTAGTPLLEWEYWWRLNRERFLRLRERVEQRNVVSGGARGEKPCDRKIPL